MHVSCIYSAHQQILEASSADPEKAATLVLLAALNFALPVQVMGSPGPPDGRLPNDKNGS